MKVSDTDLAGVKLIEPRVFGDPRGYFLETWSAARYSEIGIDGPFVQDNLSKSEQGVLRGLHLQNPGAQGKLVFVVSGCVFDVAVDVRVGSPTFGHWVAYELSAENHRQLYIPPGLAHGFCVLSDAAVFMYKCTEYYARDTEMGVLWSDPDIGIRWPVTAPKLSDKDRAWPRLSDIPRERLPRYA